MLNQKTILRYIDLSFYLMILPLFLLILPTDKMMVYDRYFFSAVIIYLISTYYINKRMNIPALLLRHKFKEAAWVMALVVSMTLVLTLIPRESMPMDITVKPEIHQKFRTFAIWMIFIVNMSFGLMIGLIIELFRQIIYRQSLETEKNKAELALYKAQINPHFLFNTLNTLYGLVLTKSEKTEEVFIKFTEALKYMYSNTESDSITIENEIEYIYNYKDLHQLRLNSQTQVEFHSQVDDPSVEIAPMILITFIENAFKYGVSSREPSTIRVNIILKDRLLSFTTDNNIFAHRISHEAGIGIENCRKRLDLLYPKRYSLEQYAKDNIFHTQLTIQL